MPFNFTMFLLTRIFPNNTPRLAARFSLFLLTLLLPSFPLAETAAATHYETELVWDPYYSSAAIYLPLTQKTMTDLGDVSESRILSHLFSNALNPRFLLLEASIYPMPIFGAYVRKHHPNFYDSLSYGELNMLQAVSAGFEEPAALSLFLGNVVKFKEPGESQEGGNRGYSGFLVSTGNKHLVENRYVDDHWLEWEWKIKADRDFGEKKYLASARIGGKLHGNPNITDVYYLGFQRHNLDFDAKVMSLWHNSNVDYQVSWDKNQLRIVEQEFLLGKKWPIKSWNVALTVDFGLILQSNLKYTGKLSNTGASGDTIFVIRPILEF